MHRPSRLESENNQMRHLGLGISLFSTSAVLSIFVWFANAPDLSLGQPSLSITPAKEVALDDANFIKLVKAALREDVAPPVKQQWVLHNTSPSKGAPQRPEKSRGLLVNASYGSSSGVGK